MLAIVPDCDEGLILFAPPNPKSTARALKLWLAALVLCTVAVVVAILFIDRPLALFLYHPYGHPKVDLVLHAVTVIVPLGALAPFLCGVFAFAGRTPPAWLATAGLCGFSLMWALVTDLILLKPLFGRENIEKLYKDPPFYGFHPFHGTMESSFPSGHAAAIASVCAVLWLLHSRLRWPSLALAALISVCLVFSNWHFVGDVLAGLFVGGTAGLMTARLWQAGR